MDTPNCAYSSRQAGICQGQKSVFSHDELQWSTAVIASSVKREAACEILLNGGASERLNELKLAGSSWLVPPAHGSASALPSSLLQCWAEAAHLGTRLPLYTGSLTAVFKKAELLSPIARQI